MKKILYLTALSLLVAGCGHSRLYESESMGAAAEIPIGDGSIVFSIGTHKITRALMRGGASLETTTTVGGGLFGAAAGQSKITHFKANAQLNEGYLADVMMSTNCPSEAKVQLAKNLEHAAEAPYFPVSVLQTKEATIHLGKAAVLSNNVEKITGHTGLDLVVETVGNVVGTNVVNNTLNTTGGIVHDVTNPLEGTVSEVATVVENADQAVKDVRNTAITVILVVVVAVLFFLVITTVLNKDPNSDMKKIIIPPNPTTSPEEAEKIIDEGQALKVDFDHEKDEPKSKVPFSTRLANFFRGCVAVVKKIISWIMLIPPPIRKKIAGKSVEWFKTWQKNRQNKKKK